MNDRTIRRVINLEKYFFSHKIVLGDLLFTSLGNLEYQKITIALVTLTILDLVRKAYSDNKRTFKANYPF